MEIGYPEVYICRHVCEAQKICNMIIHFIRIALIKNHTEIYLRVMLHMYVPNYTYTNYTYTFSINYVKLTAFTSREVLLCKITLYETLQN